MNVLNLFQPHCIPRQYCRLFDPICQIVLWVGQDPFSISNTMDHIYFTRDIYRKLHINFFDRIYSGPVIILFPLEFHSDIMTENNIYDRKKLLQFWFMYTNKGVLTSYCLCVMFGIERRIFRFVLNRITILSLFVTAC